MIANVLNFWILVELFLWGGWFLWWWKIGWRGLENFVYFCNFNFVAWKNGI